jgi:nitrogenase molybdenum-iron protein alpha chain
MTPPDNKKIVEERKELIKDVLKAYPEKAAKKRLCRF